MKQEISRFIKVNEASKELKMKIEAADTLINDLHSLYETWKNSVFDYLNLIDDTQELSKLLSDFVKLMPNTKQSFMEGKQSFMERVNFLMKKANESGR